MVNNAWTREVKVSGESRENKPRHCAKGASKRQNVLALGKLEPKIGPSFSWQW